MDLERLNIVEIGLPFVKQALPQTRVFAATIFGGGAGEDKQKLTDLWHALNQPNLDLIICHALELAPLSPRWWLRKLGNRDSWKRGIPFNSAIGPQFLRFGGRAPLAVIDMTDQFTMAKHDLFLLRKATAFFKRELPVDRWQALHGIISNRLPSSKARSRAANRALAEKLLPISLGLKLGTDRTVFPPAPLPKTADIFFAGLSTNASSVRDAGMAELKVLAGEGFRIDMPQQRLPLPEFLARAAAAHLVWSPEGYGWDCFRHYETPLCWSVPLINTPTIIRHEPLIGGQHAVYYDPEPGGLARAARLALAEPDRLARMAADARQHVLDHHMIEKQVEHIVRTTLRRAGRDGF